MESLLILLFFPVVWPFAARTIWKKTISWKEVGANIAIVAFLTAGIWFAGRYAKTADVEIWNGEVTGKEKRWVPCEHSYSCNCRRECSGSGNDRSCNQVCDTCYEHTNDWDWIIHTNIGEVKIARVDRQGAWEPQRFTRAKIRDPVSLAKFYVNYIKAVPESLFHNSADDEKRFHSLIPPYPSNVYDYYRVNRVLSAGVNVPDLQKWNEELPLVLRELGPKKQANVIILFVNTADSQYIHALEHAWLGGKKNDIIVVLGTPQYPKIEWTRVMSWTKEETFKIGLREAIKDLGTVDRDRTLALIREYTMASFKRREMRDFEYLKNEIDPPPWVIILAAVIATAGSIGLSLVFHRTDPFDR